MHALMFYMHWTNVAVGLEQNSLLAENKTVI